MTLTVEYYDRDERLRTVNIDVLDEWTALEPRELYTLTSLRLNQSKRYCNRIKSIKPTQEERAT